MRSLLSLFIARSTGRSPRHAPRRPALERLERRCLPSYVPAPGTAGDEHEHPSADYRFGDPTNPYKWEQLAPGEPITITYSYANLLNGRLGGGMNPGTTRAAIEEALGRWAAVAPLHFVEAADAGPAPSDTEYEPDGLPMMRFGHRSIDGTYETLATAYYPGLTGLAGDVTFDTAERWTVNPASGIDLIEVATHEIGHALGLDHQPESRLAIMNPQYSSTFHGLGTSFLYADDVAGIQALYGQGIGSVTPLGATSAPPPAEPAAAEGFAVEGSTLIVSGSAGADTFRYSAVGAAPLVELNGFGYVGGFDGITAVRFVGGGGADVLSLAGGAAAEEFTLTPGGAAVSGGAVAVAAEDMASVVAAAGSGDRVTVNGTDGNDVTTAAPSSVKLSFGDRHVIATGFTSAVVTAGGGVDQVTLSDSGGDDVLTVSPTEAVLTGAGFSVTAAGFDRVVATATTGTDQATLTGSAADDVFTSYPAWSRLQGGGAFSEVRGFDAVTADGAGGRDSARLYDSRSADAFVARPGAAKMTGPGFANAALGFESVTGQTTAGADTATLYDSAGDDVFTSRAGVASMVGGGYTSTARGYRSVTGLASEGRDVAVVFDGRGNDMLSAAGASGTLRRGGETVTFTGFDEVQASGRAGGRNRKPRSGFSFALRLSGWWV